ncbi:MAG: hypothetical protein ACREOJ_18370, partial [Gemmatimonadaceae bacterium]
MAGSYDNPSLVLRVGVVGAIAVADDQRSSLRARLSDVFGVMAATLEKLSPLTDSAADVPEIAGWYDAPGAAMRPRDALSTTAASAGPNPVLRVVSGLADGTDQIAFESVIAFEQAARSGVHSFAARTRVELVAVLPCDAASYRDNSAIENKAAFDSLLERCDSVIELDGRCAPRAPDLETPDPLAREQRNRAFRVQSAVLLRQCDLLIAAADPRAEGGVGGTRATLADALALEVPVVFISCDPSEERHNGIALLGRLSDLETTSACRGAHWRQDVEQAVTRILADPSAARSGAPVNAHDAAL